MTTNNDHVCIVCGKAVSLAKASKLPIDGGLALLLHPNCLAALVEAHSEQVTAGTVQKSTEGLGSSEHPNVKALRQASGDTVEARREEHIREGQRAKYEAQEQADTREAARLVAPMIVEQLRGY